MKALNGLRSLAGRTVRGIRRFRDRALQPLRRSRSSRVLEANRPPTSVLFVCLGNICRSPYAASALERTLPRGAREKVTISSAGFIGPGRPTPPESAAAARVAGIDLTSHRSQLISEVEVGSFDLIVAMEARQATQLRKNHQVPPERLLVLGDLDPEETGHRDIPDPFAGPPEVFEACYRRIDRCVAELSTLLTGASRG